MDIILGIIVVAVVGFAVRYSVGRPTFWVDPDYDRLQNERDEKDFDRRG